MSLRSMLPGLLMAAALAAPLSPMTAAPAQAEGAIDVVASIKPIHSLVAAVMQGVGTPQLIVEGAGSPHAFALKPSQARAIQEAELVFWIGPQMESFLETPLAAIAQEARSVPLGETDGMVRLALREGGAFEGHDHDHQSSDDDHDHAATHKHDDHDDDHAHDKHDHDHDGHDDHGHDDHAHGDHDTHYWLDPHNAGIMVHAIARALSQADPDNAATYQRNAKALGGRLDAMTARLQAELSPLAGRGFIVFHDAYRYFENRFGLAAAGSITVTPDVMPGAERIREIRAAVEGLDAACVFSEPQFTPNLVQVVTEGTDARAAVLDPLGATLADGPELYFELVDTMADAFKDCLTPQS